MSKLVCPNSSTANKFSSKFSMHKMLIHSFCKNCQHELVLKEYKSKQKQFHIHNSYKPRDVHNQTNRCIALEKLKKIWIRLVFNKQY